VNSLLTKSTISESVQTIFVSDYFCRYEKLILMKKPLLKIALSNSARTRAVFMITHELSFGITHSRFRENLLKHLLA
jgi:hypothetical protein